jgi:hypothetical protein
MGVVIEACVKYPGGPTRMTVTDIDTGAIYIHYIYIYIYILYIYDIMQ